MDVLQRLIDLFRDEEQSERVIPPSGFTAWLTVFISGAMAFLVVFALAFSLTAGRLADRWSAELAQSGTIRIVAPKAEMDAQVATALRILETTRGVASARALSQDEQAALLAPWFGEDLPLDSLPVPRLIDVTENADFDADGLRLRLKAELPNAVFDDHARWRVPLTDAAQRLRFLGWVSILLIGAVMGAMVTLAARSSLAANVQVVSVLRLVGATDDYIARAFIRRFSIRALVGAGAGTVVGMIAVFLLPDGGDDVSFLTDIGLRGWHWVIPLLIPPLAALTAFVATRAAARKTLEGL